MTTESAPRDEQEAPEPPGASRVDFQLGVAVAVVAALVALVELANGRFGDDELLAAEEKVSAYSWYQAKSIKEAVVAGERDLLSALLEAGVVAEERRAGVEELVRNFDTEVRRYSTEKKALLQGGTVDGQDVPGAETLKRRASELSVAGDRLDVAMLLLHLSLLLGGVGVAVQHKSLERALLRLVVGLAATGVFITLATLVLWWL